MNLSLDIYLNALSGSLREEVLPHVNHDQARSQLLAAIDTLDKLAGLTDWSPDLMAEQTGALAQTLTALSGPLGAEMAPAPADTPREDLARHEAAFDAVVDRLYDTPATADRAEVETILRDGLRKYLAAERSRISAANFSAMT